MPSPYYPGALPTPTEYPDKTDDVDWILAAIYNNLKKEVLAICTELGTDPKGASADVKTRLGLLALKASPVFTGQATIPTINLTGGQIAFPASQSASADANTLDDYEEGSATLTMTALTTPPDNPPTTTAYYTKIGNLVTVSAYFANSNTTGAVGDMSITGLPFTSSANSNATGTFTIEGFAFDETKLHTLVNLANTSYVRIIQIATGMYGTYLDITAGTGKYMKLQITYSI